MEKAVMKMQSQSESLDPEKGTNGNERSVDGIGGSADGILSGLTVEQLLIDNRILKKGAEIEKASMQSQMESQMETLRKERDFPMFHGPLARGYKHTS